MFETGFFGQNKQGLDFEVIDGDRSKNTRIRFLLDGAEVMTTKAYLNKGLPLHPTYGKIQEGEIFLDKDGLEFVITECCKDWGYITTYKLDGFTTKRDRRCIQESKGRHPSNVILAPGRVFFTRSGEITVVEYKNANHVVVQFSDGVQTKTTAAAVRNGVVGHPTSNLAIGQKIQTNSGWHGEIISYKDCRNVTVLWQDGSTSDEEASHILKGSIKPVFQPSVAGVGFYGSGRFSSGLKSKGETPPKEIYSYWQRMLTRCFNPEDILKSTGRRYVFAEVTSDWFNFQNFAEWALSQPNWSFGFDLDKDLLGTNLEYSPDNCCFLPPSVNIFLAENWSKSTHELPIGVQYIRPATQGAKGGFVARCHTDKGREYLGYFDDPMEAHFAYKARKEEYAKVLAEKYKSVITDAAYKALKNFTINQVYPTPTFSCNN